MTLFLTLPRVDYDRLLRKLRYLIGSSATNLHPSTFDLEFKKNSRRLSPDLRARPSKRRRRLQDPQSIHCIPDSILDAGYDRDSGTRLPATTWCVTVYTKKNIINIIIIFFGGDFGKNWNTFTLESCWKANRQPTDDVVLCSVLATRWLYSSSFLSEWQARFLGHTAVWRSAVAS